MIFNKKTNFDPFDLKIDQILNHDGPKQLNSKIESDLATLLKNSKTLLFCVPLCLLRSQTQFG